MTTGPFGVEVISKVNPFKAKAQVKGQLKLVKAAGDPAKSKRLFNGIAGLNGPTKASLGNTRSYGSQRPSLNK
jgi:hypothetical protein